MGDKIIHIHSFDEWTENLAKAGDKLVVVDFTAAWCGPCKMVAPAFAEYSNQFDAVFLKVDVDEVEQVAAECQIRAMPTFQFFKNGKKVTDFTGANANKLKEFIQNNL